MCNPVAVVVIGSAILTAYSKYEESRAEAAQLDQQAAFQLQQAGDARLRGQSQAGLSKLETSQLIGQQHTQYANAQVDPNFGTPVTTYGDTRAIGELRVAEIQNQAAREAWGFESNAAMSKYGAQMKRRAGNISAATSIIGGIASGYYAGTQGPTLATTGNTPLGSTVDISNFAPGASSMRKFGS